VIDYMLKQGSPTISTSKLGSLDVVVIRYQTIVGEGIDLRRGLRNQSRKPDCMKVTEDEILS
jgi:hypothetical protein